MKDNDKVKEVLNLFVLNRDPKIKPDIDYTKDFEIMCEKTGRELGEEMRLEGKSIVENGRVVGGWVKGSICYKGYGTSTACGTDGIRLSKDEWIKFVNKSVQISERREKERVAFEKKLEKERQIREYQKKHPVETFLSSYLKDEDYVKPEKLPDYSKNYEIDADTGAGLKEHLEAYGEPVIKNGEVVGGVIKAKISRSCPHDAIIREHSYERVSLEYWEAFVHKSIKVNHEKRLNMERIYGKSK
jgi:hypothetical protein